MKTKNRVTPKPATQKRIDELNVIIRRAALTIDPKGRIEELAKHCHVSTASIRDSIRYGRFSVGLACTLEAMIGREHIKREDLCPKLAK